jgi:predicted transcriptional regulator
MRAAPPAALVMLATVLGAGLAVAQATLPTLSTPTTASPSTGVSAPVSAPVGGSPVTDLFGKLDLTSGVVIGLGIVLAIGAATLLFLGGAKFVNSENVLENEARRQIFEYVQAHPGVHLRAAATQLNLSTTNVLWHLRKLEDANLVTSKKFEGYKVFYPVEGGVETKKRAIANSVLKNDNAMQILHYVNANPSAHQREIARALGVNHGTVRWHLRKLEEAQLVSPVKKEHTTHYYVSELGLDAMRGFAEQSITPMTPPAAPPAASIPGDDEHAQ